MTNFFLDLSARGHVPNTEAGILIDRGSGSLLLKFLIPAFLAVFVAQAESAQAAFMTSSGQPAPLEPSEWLSPMMRSIAPDRQEGDFDWEGPPYPELGAGENGRSLPAHADSEEVPIVFNESVENYVNYFQNDIPTRFNIWLERSGHYLDMMKRIFREHGLPDDLVYLSLIESGFNPKAHSRAHAVGPWQFMAGTARTYDLAIDRWVDERKDPVKSTKAAARHLKDLYARFGTWPLAMASYNAGAGKIERGLIKAKTDNYWDLRQTAFIRSETRGYVPKFMAAMLIAKNPHRYGFYPEYHDPFSYDAVEVPGMASLSVIAEASEISVSELRDLNPELRTAITPPSESGYQLRLPKGKMQSFEGAYAGIPESRKIFRTRYVVRKNDTLSGIARRYGTSAGTLAKINSRSTRSILHIGEVIYIPKIDPVYPSRTSRVAEVVPITDGSSDSRSNKIIYRVQAGDTLWDISRHFKVSLANLKQHNGLDRRARIYPGDVLILGFQ
jgi:membrane-bound lytic murein transglycosylase D